MPKKKRPAPVARRYNDKHLRRVFPGWVPIIYGLACLVLIPWTILLGYLLPPVYVSHHWDVAWAGFDVFEALLFALTAILAVKKSSWTALSAAMLGTVLLIDAWFDVLTARSGMDQYKAIVEALFVELPLAVISYALSHRIFNDARHHQIKP